MKLHKPPQLNRKIGMHGTIAIVRSIVALSMFPIFNAFALLLFPYIEFSIVGRSVGVLALQLLASALFFDLLVSSFVSGVPAAVRARVGSRYVSRGWEEISEVFWGSLLLAVPALLAAVALRAIIPFVATMLESNALMSNALTAYMEISVFCLPFSLIQGCSTAYLVGQKKTRFRMLSALILQMTYISIILVVVGRGQATSLFLVAHRLGMASLISSMTGAGAMFTVAVFNSRPTTVRWGAIFATAGSVVPQALHASGMQIALTASSLAILRCGSALAYPGPVLFALFLRYARDLCSLGRGVGEGLSIFISNLRTSVDQRNVVLAPYLSSFIVIVLFVVVLPSLAFALHTPLMMSFPSELFDDTVKVMPIFFLGVVLDSSTICFLFAMQGLKKNQVALRVSVVQLIMLVPLTYFLTYVVKLTFFEFFSCFVVQKAFPLLYASQQWRRLSCNTKELVLMDKAA